MMPRNRFAVIALAVALFACGPVKSAYCQPSHQDLYPRPGARPSRTKPRGPSAAYLKALRTADEFMMLWVHRDGEEAWPMLSNRLKRKVGDRFTFLQFMSGLSNPQHQAFAIAPVATGPADYYSFPVVTYELALSDAVGNSERGEIGVVRENGEWKIDRLPLQHS